MINKREFIEMTEEEHRTYHRRIIYVVIVILLFFFGGATFYHKIEGWRYIDALYFSAATMTTVGYGDLTPKTDIGKIFTIVYVFAGVGIALYGLSVIAAHFVEVREEFWLERIGKTKIRHHTRNFWEKIKSLFSYSAKEIIYETEIKPRKK